CGGHAGQDEGDAAQGSGHGADEETRQAGAEGHGLFHEQWPAVHDAGQPQPVRDQFLIISQRIQPLASGHHRAVKCPLIMSALPPKADMCGPTMCAALIVCRSVSPEKRPWWAVTRESCRDS